jgi:serine-type D-Ala-D-Ala carboxypeptidase
MPVAGTPSEAPKSIAEANRRSGCFQHEAVRIELILRLYTSWITHLKGLKSQVPFSQPVFAKCSATICLYFIVNISWPQRVNLTDASSADLAQKTPAHSPAPAYDQQDLQFADAFEILNKGIAEHAFPGASVAVTHHGGLVALKAVGRFTYEPSSPEVMAATIFDVASVSKVVATTSMAMILYERGLLDLEAPVVALAPEFMGNGRSRVDPRRKEVTIYMLLAHSSGLPAYEKLFQRASKKEDLLSLAFATDLTADPGTRAAYSDIGFIILGTVLERIADESLDRFCQREIFGTLGMTYTTFNPPSAWRSSIPPTSRGDDSRDHIIQGEVQDENAYVMGGVAGHAGAFSSATDLAIFANSMLNEGRPLIRPETLKLFTSRESSPTGTSRTLGWDTPSVPSQSGKYFSANSFGHLGYTGTSLWIDPQRQLSIVMLTNRTWPDCSNAGIKQIRPMFHDAIVEALEAGSNR